MIRMNLPTLLLKPIITQKKLAMRRITFRTLSMTIAMLFLGLGLATAQTAKEAVEAFNAGVTANQEKDYPLALSLFTKAIEIGTQVGTEADGIRIQAEGVVANIQFSIGMGLYNQKKIEEAIVEITKAKELAIKYDDQKTLAKAEKTIPQFYNFLGNSALREGQAEKAIENYSKCITLDSTYVRSYLGLGRAYIKLNNYEKALATFDKTIKVGTTANKMEEVQDAKKMACSITLMNAGMEQKKENFANCYKFATQALTYDDQNLDAFMKIAISANKLSKFDEAIENINKALPLVEAKDDATKAPYYFHLAEAYVGKKDNISACGAYKKASFGIYKDAAEYQVNKVLKCQ